MPSLRRLSDGAGDSGAMSVAMRLSVSGDGWVVEGERPIVGCVMKVGSISARSYSYQDWWMTTEVTEILEDTPEMVRFLTRSGSEYEWKC